MASRPGYSISDIFYSWQGEGYLVGVPAVFVRFYGCNLSCNWCDETDIEGVYLLGVASILTRIEDLPKPYGKNACVILTGGEPLMQVGSELLEALRGTCVVVETNGTLPPPRIEAYRDKCLHDITYVVSPKPHVAVADIHSSGCPVVCKIVFPSTHSREAVGFYNYDVLASAIEPLLPASVVFQMQTRPGVGKFDNRHVSAMFDAMEHVASKYGVPVAISHQLQKVLHFK